ncbi:MBL fold metallo-hydrolase [Dokdonella sp.]|uniref:MBL fold metallo-hydrolase n=1 Tax=Dokdonella sp. TaxID=2291710 RepID=UPI00352710D2
MNRIWFSLMSGLLILAATAGPANSDQSSVDVASGIQLLPGQLQADRSPDGNSLILRGEEGLVVIDTGRGNEHTRQLIDLVSESGLPLVGVINTHWHLDHIGGNARFKQRWPGLHIYAHPSLDTALGGFHADYRKQLDAYLPTLAEGSPEQQRYQAEMDLLKQDRKLAETDPLRKSTTLTLGGRILEVHVSEHSVTEGDLWIFDPQTRTLIAGDLVTLPVPMFDSACPEGWKRTLDKIAATRFRQLVPGHGAPMGPENFSTYREAFNRLLECSASNTDKQTCINQWFAQMKPMIAQADEAYGRTLLGYYIDQFIRPDAPGRKRWCSQKD